MFRLQRLEGFQGQRLAIHLSVVKYNLQVQNLSNRHTNVLN